MEYLATVSDRKFGVSSAGSSLIDYYEPPIVTAQDYYPFGMLSRVALPNNNKDYRFGFNGNMNDNEVKGGLGNQQDPPLLTLPLLIHSLPEPQAFFSSTTKQAHFIGEQQEVDFIYYRLVSH